MFALSTGDSCFDVETVSGVTDGCNIAPGSVVGSALLVNYDNTTATVTLNLPAPANGATVTLTSSKPGNLPVPASVLIPPNQTSVTFKAVGTGVPSNNSVDLVVTASYAGSSVQANVTVKGPYLG